MAKRVKQEVESYSGSEDDCVNGAGNDKHRSEKQDSNEPQESINKLSLCIKGLEGNVAALALLREFPTACNVKLVKNKHSKKTRVDFKTKALAAAALKNCTNKKIDGKKVHVAYAKLSSDAGELVDEKSLSLEGLGKKTSEFTLLREFPAAQNVKIIKACPSRAYLDFKTEALAAEALKNSAIKTINGKPVTITYARSVPIDQQKRIRGGVKAIVKFPENSEEITKQDLKLVFPTARSINFLKRERGAASMFVDAETAKKLCTGNVEVKGVTVQVQLLEAIQTNNEAQNKAAVNSKAGNTAAQKKRTSMESMKTKNANKKQKLAAAQ